LRQNVKKGMTKNKADRNCAEGAVKRILLDGNFLKDVLNHQHFLDV
jgi:hypothetical protein